ncbi:MAG: hypothetical protein ABIH25_02920 [Candidatus Woesearchaeota archaeon]
MIFGRKQPKSQVEKLEERMKEHPYNVVSMVAKNFGVNPNRLYLDVQNTYRDCLKDGDFGRMRLIREITEVEPSRETASKIQYMYINYAKERKSGEIMTLMEASGVPMFDAAQVTYLERNLTTTLVPREELV